MYPSDNKINAKNLHIYRTMVSEFEKNGAKLVKISFFLNLKWEHVFKKNENRTDNWAD